MVRVIDDWTLEKQIIHEIMETLNQYDFIASIKCKFLSAENSLPNRNPS